MVHGSQFIDNKDGTAGIGLQVNWKGVTSCFFCMFFGIPSATSLFFRCYEPFSKERTFGLLFFAGFARADLYLLAAAEGRAVPSVAAKKCTKVRDKQTAM